MLLVDEFSSQKKVVDESKHVDLAEVRRKKETISHNKAVFDLLCSILSINMSLKNLTKHIPEREKLLN